MKNLFMHLSSGILCLNSLHSLMAADCGRGFDKCYYLADPSVETAENERAGSEVVEEPKIWYHRHNRPESNVDFNDPTGRLEERTAWPGAREEFSDTIFRDNDPSYRDHP